MRGGEEDKPKGMHCMGPLKPATEMSGTALHHQSLLEKKTLFPVLCLLVGDSNPANACKVLWLLVVTYSDMHSGGESHLAADQLIERLPAIDNSNVMENGVFGVPIDMAGRESVAIDGTALQTAPNSLVQFGSFDLNNQNEALARYTMLSAVQEPISDLQADVPTVNRGSVIRSDTLVPSVGRSVYRDIPPGSLHSIANFELQEQLPGGPPITATALAMLLARRSGFQENLNNLPISGPSIPPLETSRTYVACDCSNALNSSFGPTLDDGCDERFDNLNGKADFDRLPVPVELCEKVPVRAGYQLCTSMQNPESNAWMLSNFMNLGTDNPFGSCKFSNELSLSLTTSEPSVINGTNISDQCSEISGSGAMGHCLKETRLDLKRTSCNSKELSLSCGCYKVAPFSQVISGSKYLNVIQEILAQIASYSLDNLDQMNFSASGIKTGANTSVSRTTDGEMQHMQHIACAASANVDGRFEVSMDPALQKRALQAKRAQLLTLLQLVDERYNQCLDEIHTVISAFHAATELDPHLHTRFALQTVSVLYKGLRERISNQILAMGTQFDNGCTKEIEGSFETAYLQKQWTIQQLKKKDQQLWRPQRGLPERSVAVLRAWMFQNFLHPYPKDAEKHLLAVKSGLTRSQVSNWFINARVRLWKPMIEEMYAEMNKRKASQNEEGTNCYRRNQFGINSTRFNVNPI